MENKFGFILDFNGTLYQDHDLNDYAWSLAFDSVKNNNDTNFKDFFTNNIETLTKDNDFSKAILELFGQDSSEENIQKLSNYKEDTYIYLAKSLNRTALTKGAEKFLDYLKSDSISYCIASMAPKMNFDFYLDYLSLNKWFDYKNIVYDSIEYKNKNEQYTEAAKRMNKNISNCILIEDSPKVIERSKEIGINKIIYMNSKNKECNAEGIIQEVKNFDEIDINLIKNIL